MNKKKKYPLLRKVLRSIGLILLIIITSIYWFTNIYDFPEPKEFSGDYWHNPYEGLRGNNWQIGNFHTHGKAWLGVSHGIGSQAELYDTYLNKMKYDLLGISNYQTIDTNADQIHQIRAYEHGYSPFKYHHIVLGANEVTWKDYPLWQSIHHKQQVINALRETDSNSLIAIAHPKRGMAISFNDIQNLTGYECIEAFNHLSTSIHHWDMALSSGNPMYLLSNDDTHDHTEIFQTGRLGTAVYVPDNELNQINVINALKKGQSYAIEFHTQGNETFEIHKKRVLKLPYLKQAEVKNDSFRVEFSESFDTLEFIGQGGRLLQLIERQQFASYKLKAEDTYVRVKLKFSNSRHIFFLNPVFRYNGKEIVKKVATVNVPFTILYRILLGCLILYLVAKLFGIKYFQLLKRKSS